MEQQEIKIVDTKIDIDGNATNFIKKFAFMPVMVKLNDGGIYKYIWFKSYFEKYVFTKYNNYKMDMFGNIRIVEEVEWVHTENIDYVK